MCLIFSAISLLPTLLKSRNPLKKNGGDLSSAERRGTFPLHLPLYLLRRPRAGAIKCYLSPLKYEPNITITTH